MVYLEWQRILKQRRRSSIAFQALSVARSFEKERRYAAIPRFKKNRRFTRSEAEQ